MVAIDTRRVGNAVVALGGGRTRPGETIDPSVGLTGLAAPGEIADAPFVRIHAADDESALRAESMLLEAYRWG